MSSCSTGFGGGELELGDRFFLASGLPLAISTSRGHPQKCHTATQTSATADPKISSCVEDTPLYLENLLKKAIQELETILKQRNQRNELPL
ncbi:MULTISPECIES: hypothetical protein [unclassified Microcoleus]|uniref:hypothetical protein n=1 Tax=unclassified Microcoleus TaxID=2642155 RepID=UPI002FCF9F95